MSTVYFSIHEDREVITIRAGIGVIEIPMDTWREINLALLKYMNASDQLSTHSAGLVEH